jgi:hypothetical protein
LPSGADEIAAVRFGDDFHFFRNCFFCGLIEVLCGDLAEISEERVAREANEDEIVGKAQERPAPVNIHCRGDGAVQNHAHDPAELEKQEQSNDRNENDEKNGLQDGAIGSAEALGTPDGDPEDRVKISDEMNDSNQEKIPGIARFISVTKTGAGVVSCKNIEGENERKRAGELAKERQELAGGEFTQ